VTVFFFDYPSESGKMDTKFKEYPMDKSFRKMQTGRMSLLLMIILTIVNYMLWLSGIRLDFPYSAFVPQLLAWSANTLYKNFGFSTEVILFAGFGLALIGLYYYSFVQSRTKAKGFLIALSAYVIDSAVFLYLYISYATQFSVIIAILMHGLITFHLFRAYRELKKNPGTVVWLKQDRQ
jgi:hypothetical protein